MSDRLNQIIYVGIIFGTLGFATAWKLNSQIPLALAAFLGAVICWKSFYTIFQIISFREGFNNPDKVEPSVDVIGVKNKGIASEPILETSPTARNPFMNVLVDEIKYNPGRPPAASVLDPSIRVSLDEFFRTEFYSDPTDVFGKTQGQRQFITMPSTSIPNDVESYQNWLYRIPGKTCKEGGVEACLPGTDGGALPWLNQDSRAPISEDEFDNSQVDRNPAPYIGSGSLSGTAI